DDPAAAIAGWGLVGCELAVPPPAGTWDGMFHTIRRERLSGLAVSAVAAGALDLTTDQRDGLRAAHAVAMVHALRLERFLLDSIELFEGAGIEALVLKGPAMAHRHHADPRERPFGDIDVLVPSDQLDAAFDLLAASGHQRRYPEPRPGFDRRFGKGAAFVSPEGLELDVHRTFAAGPFGIRVRLEDAHAAPASFTVGGRVVRTLADGPMLVSVAMHAVLGTHRSRLLNLRDVAQLLGGADEATVAALATRWGADAVLAEAVRRASGAFGLDPALPLVGWASAHQGDRRQLRAMSAYTTADRSYGGQALAALPAISRWTDRASYLRALVLPHRSYLADRDRSQLARWRRMTTSAVRQARRAGR
ncbi:MAG TPA: nucleotidyltransferase family protein, partial [Gemmatimonadaceae bacterium]|nr:nucleotidyltransferase family protein [Gemmatimonadaceae bacterium]